MYNSTPHISALIVAAGVGSRVGGEVPKQYRAVGGRAMLWYSAAALSAHPDVREVRVVIAEKDRERYDEATKGLALPEPIIGGARRQDSVRLGLKALEASAPDYVLIHDAARPFLSRAVLDRLLAALSPDHAVLPALPVGGPLLGALLGPLLGAALGELAAELAARQRDGLAILQRSAVVGLAVVSGMLVSKLAQALGITINTCVFAHDVLDCFDGVA